MKGDERLPHSFSLRASGFQHTCWKPPVDIYKGREGWLIKFDLAGVRIEDIQIFVQDCKLTVAGIRRDWTILEEQRAGRWKFPTTASSAPCACRAASRIFRCAANTATECCLSSSLRKGRAHER